MIKSYIKSVLYLLITWNLLEHILHASWIIILTDEIEKILGLNILSQGLTI